MFMRKIIIIIIFLLSFLKSFSQEVSVRQSIEWKKTKSNRWKDYKLNKTPFLVITYQNKTKDAIYFKSGFKNFDFSYSFSACLTKSIKKININDYLNIRSNRNYMVDVFFFDWTNNWDVFEQNILERDIDIENYYLGEIYQNFYKDYKKQDKVYYIYGTNVLPLTEKNITGELKDYFIFLKPNESYSVKYDLTGFQILGGNYTFNYFMKQAEKYVKTTATWDEKEKKWINNIEYLPKKVNNYNLYTGEFITNDVKISFD